MNQEDISGNSPMQEGKSATYRRSNKGRNRPVLVTSDQEQEESPASNDASSADSSQVVRTTPATNVAEDTQGTTARSRPKFFSTIGRKETTAEEKVADPAAARLARATRGKAASNGKKEAQEPKESKETTSKAVAPAKAAPARPAAARPGARPSAFKPRHFIGILIYIIVADVAGIYEKNLLVSAKLEKLLFTLGPLPVYLSTVVFLLTLVLLLIVLARFDLVPRSLGSPRTAPKSTSNTTRGNDPGSKEQPTMKQGVKGANDALYQEYRQNQRYWQRRDRKK
jgi:hypothetical protein